MFMMRLSFVGLWWALTSIRRLMTGLNLLCLSCWIRLISGLLLFSLLTKM